jgi:hypothetical protein
MSFFYNARWGNPVPYQTMGHWGGGYALSGVDAAGYSTPYDADDFYDEDLAKAAKALNALKALQAVPAALRQRADADGVGGPALKTTANVLENMMAKIAPLVASASNNVFDMVGPSRDPDPTLYVVYSTIHDASPIGDVGIEAWKALGEQLPSAHGFSSLDELTDALGELYETYYDTYWDTEAAKQTAAGQPVAAKPAPKTGKPRKVPPKQQPLPTPRKSSNILKYALIGGLVLGGALLGMKLLKK